MKSNQKTTGPDFVLALLPTDYTITNIMSSVGE